MFTKDELARRETLTALLFRLEHCREAEDLVRLIDEVIGWFRQHPGYEALKELFSELVAQTAQTVEGDQGFKVPDDLLEARSMMATRMEDWKKRWLAKTRDEVRAAMAPELRAELRPELRAELRAELIPEVRAEILAEISTNGKAAMLLRQLHRRRGSLSPDIEARVRAASDEQLDAWMDRLADGQTLDDLSPASMA